MMHHKQKTQQSTIKQAGITLLLGILLGGIPVFGIEREPVISPQYHMVGARLHSLGGIVPSIKSDINGVLINPGSIGGVQTLQANLTQQKVIGEFDYTVVGVVIPYAGYGIGITYGSDMLSGIQETTLVSSGTESMIYPVDTFSSGFELLHLSLGTTSYFDVFNLDQLSYGVGFKILEQSVGSDSRQSYGMDLGFISSFYMPEYLGMDRIHLGVSMINALSTPFPEWEDSKKNALSRQLFIGAQVDTLDEQLSLFLNWKGLEEVYEYSAGLEYQITDILRLRGSILTDNTDEKNFKYNIGTGLFLERVSGFGYDEYSLRVDYNLHVPRFPFSEDYTHTISFSFLGEARVKRAYITYPIRGYSTNDTSVDLKGKSERYADVRVFNNNFESRTIKADKFGRWKYKNFPLEEGQNSIVLRSKKIGRDVSYQSEALKIISDTISPQFKIYVVPERGKLSIYAITDESAKKVEGKVGRKRALIFKKVNDNEYLYEMGLPRQYINESYITEKITTFSVTVWDHVGNQSITQYSQYLVSLSNPRDKSIIYGDKITLLGNASPVVKTLKINGEVVSVDPQFSFQYPLILMPGKNLVMIEVDTLNNQKFTYFSRVLSIKRFPDIDRKFKGRRDIELIATMGFIQPRPDGNFYPEEKLTRMDITRFLVEFNRVELTPTEYSPTLDVPQGSPEAPYIRAAIDEGLMAAFPDGTFKPDQLITVKDAYDILVNNEIIESDELIIDTDPITRAEFALLLKQMPSYEARVEFLIDWIRGYKPK